MNNTFHPETLNDILDAYVSTVQDPNRDILMEWIRKHPQYERELTEFTIAWIQMETLPPVERVELKNNVLVLRGMSILQNLLHENKDKLTPAQLVSHPFRQLIAEGKSNGLSPEQFANLLKLSVALLSKLDRRLILYSSIPLELIEKIGSAIHRGVPSIAEYFLQQPALSNKSSYKADQQPKVSAQHDFFDEVRQDLELSDEYRNYWIEIESRNQ